MSCCYVPCEVTLCPKVLCPYTPICCSTCNCINCICCPRCCSFPCKCCPICLNPCCKCCKICLSYPCKCCCKCLSYPCKCCIGCHAYPCICCTKITCCTPPVPCPSLCKPITCRTVRCLSPCKIICRPMCYSPCKIRCFSPKRPCLNFNY